MCILYYRCLISSSKLGKQSRHSTFGLHDDRFVSSCLCPNIMRANKMLICGAVSLPLFNQLCLFPLVLLKSWQKSCFACFHHCCCWFCAGMTRKRKRQCASNSTIWDYFFFFIVISGGFSRGGDKLQIKHGDVTSGLSINSQSCFIYWLFLFTFQIFSIHAQFI